MAFIRKSADTHTLKDPVFEIAQRAQADMKVNGDLVVNATIGTLYGEDGRLVAYESVYHYYDHLDSRIKAKYAAGVAGNANYRNSVYRWVFGDIKIDLPFPRDRSSREFVEYRNDILNKLHFAGKKGE